MIFSCVIPCSQKDLKSQKLQDLIDSIKAQDFPQDQIEILVITEGDSEQAKAIGIRRAKGEICAMFCADNMIMEKELFKKMVGYVRVYSAAYPERYFYKEDDNSLNRYFSLFGGNDPVCWFLGKNDREPQIKVFSLLKRESDYLPSYGCNGFFYKSDLIKRTNLDHYYPMDNALEFIALSGNKPKPVFSSAIWHRTSDNLISFLIKRYKYARDLFSDRQDRRWKMVDGAQDYWKLAYFVLCTLTIIPLLFTSFRGFSKVRDWAWFWHWPICFGFLITYSILALRNLFKHGRLFQCRAPLPQA